MKNILFIGFSSLTLFTFAHAGLDEEMRMSFLQLSKHTPLAVIKVDDANTKKAVAKGCPVDALVDKSCMREAFKASDKFKDNAVK